ncbi:MAG: TlpA disulfide reductase family protein [Planctomycetota bacterium]
MSNETESANMSAAGQEASSSGLKGVIRIVLPIVIVFGLYQGVMFGIRKYVDTKIEAPIGRPVEDFVLTDIDGGTWRASELRGKAVILHFFRSQCVSCHAMKRDMKRFAKELDAEKAQVLYLMVDKVQGFPEDMSARTILDMAFDGPVVMVDEAFVDAFYGSDWANVTPITYLVNQEGQVARALRGQQSYDELKAFVPSSLFD